MTRVREPAVAGRFYPGDTRALSEMVRDLLAQATPAAPREPAGPAARGRLVALVAPHAGYVYSGAVAAAAYGLLRGSAIRRVIVIAPSHRIPLRGSSILEEGAYRTPLGLVPIDETLAKAIRARARSEVVVDPELHRYEHALEVQLPFLQEVLPGFRLVPIVMGLQSEPHVTILAEAIATAVRDVASEEPVLLVASTDLSHYYADETARAMDGVLVKDIETFDPSGLYRHLEEGVCEACGGGPLVATLRAARLLGADRARVLSYATSGDACGDRDQVVGYVAAAVTSEGEAAPR